MFKLCPWTSCGRISLLWCIGNRLKLAWESCLSTREELISSTREALLLTMAGFFFFFPTERWRIKQGNAFLSFSSGCIRTYSKFSWYLKDVYQTLAVFRWLELSCLVSLTLKYARMQCRSSLLIIKLIIT